MEKSSAGSRIEVGRAPASSPSANWGGGGMSLGSPRGAPASAHASRTAISWCVSDWSCLSLGPTPGSGFQGGICRSLATMAISAARFRACSIRLQGEGADVMAAMAILALLLKDRAPRPW